jgi:transcriptional regulator with XRE-family HTH domain
MLVDVDSAYTLGAAVRRRRVELGLSQAEVAARAGISRQLLVHIEQGHPRAELARVLAAVRAVEARLVVDDETPTPSATNLDTILGGA